MPKVSVIIPNYNHARFLPKRLESVLGQTFGDFEVIFLDDASTDDSLAVLDRYRSDPRMRVEVNAINSGSPFIQWNKGVSLARAPYVWIAESDDWAEPQFLERLLPLLEENPRLGLAYCRSVTTDEADRASDGVDRYLANFDPVRWNSDYVAVGRAECLRYLFVGNTIPNASAVLFRRETYVRGGMADEDQRLTGDWRLWAKMLWISDLAYVAEPLNHYRCHAGTVGTQAQRSGIWPEECYSCVGFFSRRFHVPEPVRRRALRMLARQWAHVVVHVGQPSPLVNLRVLWRIRETDPLAGARLATRVARHRSWTPERIVGRLLRLLLRFAPEGWQLERKRRRMKRPAASVSLR